MKNRLTEFDHIINEKKKEQWTVLYLKYKYMGEIFEKHMNEENMYLG